MKIILLVCLISFLIGGVACNDSTSYKKLKATAARINTSLPQYDKDSTMRVDSVYSIPEDTIVYNATFLKIDEKRLNMKCVKDTKEQRMLVIMKTSPGFKAFRDNNVSLVYNYRDIEKHPLFSVYITPDKYKK
jgi:hypothetical protein